jgi:hypothetical protein
MRCVILGCGTSSGVPRIGNDWGACDPAEPRNRRLRASILVEDRGTRLLVDTSPDLRAQCLVNEIDSVDAVLYPMTMPITRMASTIYACLRIARANLSTSMRTRRRWLS